MARLLPSGGEIIHSDYMTTPATRPVSAGAPADTTVAELADDTIRRSVRALIAARATTPDAVADAIGMTRSTFYRRVSGRGAPFTAGEVQAIADVFEVPVADLFSGLGGVVVPLRSRRMGRPAAMGNAAQSWLGLAPAG